MMRRLGLHVRSGVLSLSVCIICSSQLGCLQEAQTPSVERGVAVLIALLQDGDPDIRRTAVESLGKIGAHSALPVVSPLLSDPMPAVRAAAAQALGRIASPADEAAIAGLSRLLADPDDGVRQVAALAIGDIEPPARLVLRVADLLRSSDVKVRRAAARALMPLDTAQVAEWVLPALADPDAEVRQTAVAALGFSGDARAATALGKRLVEDPSPAVRAEAAYHVGELGGMDAHKVLQAAAIKEADHGVRRWIEAELRGLRGND